MAAPFTMHVELGKAREFARAVGHHEPIDVGSPVPVAFLQTMAFWAGPDSALWREDRDMSRVLHGQQEFAFHGGPIRVGETLVGRPRMGETYTKAGKRGGTMTFIELVTDFYSPEGTLRAECKILSIETEAAPK
jgi:hypothetical protein